MSTIELPTLLNNVRNTGESRWVAECPAHEDKSPSLCVTRAGDRWLIHCFAGCTPVEIVRSIGLELADLFDDRKVHRNDERHQIRLSASEALRALDSEITVAMIILDESTKSRDIDKESWNRLALASARIGGARALICPEILR